MAQREVRVDGVVVAPAPALLADVAVVLEIDDDLLDAYSSDEKRQDVLMTMLPALHRSAPERVDELLARYVTDPARRAAIEAQIRVQGGGLFTSGR